MYIGFELVTERTWTILPNSSFSIAIVWDNKKIPSSIGKDIYYTDGMVLPNKTLTGTGRIHHLSESTINHFESLQAPSCQLIKAPDTPPHNLQVEISVPSANLLHTIYQTTLLRFWTMKETSSKKRAINIFPEGNLVQSIQSKQHLMGVSHIIDKFFKQV